METYPNSVTQVLLCQQQQVSCLRCTHKKTVKRLGLFQPQWLTHSVPVLCTFYTYSSSLMIFEVMRVNGIAEPSSIYLKSRLVYNSTVAIYVASREKTHKTFIGFIRKWLYFWSVVLSSRSLCLAEFPWTKLESQCLQRFVELLSENVKLLLYFVLRWHPSCYLTVFVKPFSVLWLPLL